MILQPWLPTGPDPNGLLCAVAGVVGVANNDRALADAVANAFGLPSETFHVVPPTWPPSYSIYNDGSAILSCWRGQATNPERLISAFGAFFPYKFDSRMPLANSAWAFSPTTSNVCRAWLADMPADLSTYDVYLCGTSYGAAMLFQASIYLLVSGNRPRSLQVITLGEPMNLWGPWSGPLPDLHVRLMTPRDPIPSIVPAGQQSYLTQMALSVFSAQQFQWHHYGDPYVLRNAGIIPLSTLAPLTWEDVVTGNFSPSDHSINSGYLPAILAWYRAQNPTPFLTGVYNAVAPYAGAQLLADTIVPTVPSSLVPFNETWFGESSVPATPANYPDWQQVGAVATILPENAGGGMTAMRGSFLWQQGGQGWSETLFDISGTLSYIGMYNAMLAVLPARQGMMVTPLGATGASDPQSICSLAWFRISDDNVFRDSYLKAGIQLASFVTGAVENLPPENCFEVKYSNAPTQWALEYPRPYPNLGSSSMEGRFATPAAAWTAALNTYIVALQTQGLGFRTWLATWAPPNNKPTAVVWNPATSRWAITTPLALPTPKATVRFNGFKNLRFLNGRRPCIQTGANTFEVVGLFPSVQVGGVGSTWDGNGFVTPFSWVPQRVSSYDVREFTTRRVGRPFYLSRGRQRNRVVS